MALMTPERAASSSAQGKPFLQRRCSLEMPIANTCGALSCSEMLVQWTTRDKGIPVVHWRPKGGSSSNLSSAEAGSDTYTRGHLCGGVANSTGFIDPGMFHTAKLTGLQPSTEYLYSYGDKVSILQLLYCALLIAWFPVTAILFGSCIISEYYMPLVLAKSTTMGALKVDIAKRCYPQ